MFLAGAELRTGAHGDNGDSGNADRIRSARGGDEEGLEEAVAETVATENVPLENLDEFSVPTYSPQELLNRKDFSEMGVEESRAIARAILLIATKIATQISRRKKLGRKGNVVDPRWTMRKNMKYGGEIIDLVNRKRRIKKTRVVLLCDVSGSMDCYSRFLIQFMYGLQNELWGGDLCLQHFPQPHHPSDSHQRHR